MVSLEISDPDRSRALARNTAKMASTQKQGKMVSLDPFTPLQKESCVDRDSSLI